MEYTEKITWEGRSLVLRRAVKPTEVLSAQSGEVKIAPPTRKVFPDGAGGGAA